MIFQILLQIFLIALNALFASTEIAVLSLNEAKLKKQAEEGDRKAAKMLTMVEAPTSFLSTIQIGITLAGFLGSAFAADNFSDYLVNFLVNVCRLPISVEILDKISVIIITLILSYFTLVFGELVPKRVAMRKSESLARLTSGFIAFLATILKPFIAFMSFSTNTVLRLLRIDPNAQDETVSEEDIILMVDEGEEKGAIEGKEKTMIENIFDFNDTTVDKIMIPRRNVTFLNKTSTTKEILTVMEESGFSRFPVIGKNVDDIVGVLRSREFFLAVAKEKPFSLDDLLIPAYFAPEGIKADELFDQLQKHKTHMAIIVDEYGGTSGIVTMEDLLEEIVGDIYDEADEIETPSISKVDENTWIIFGSTPLEDAEKAIGRDLRDEKSEYYNTVSGFVLDHLGSFPSDGTTPEFQVHDLLVQVESIKNHRIESVKLTLLPE